MSAKKNSRSHRTEQARTAKMVAASPDIAASDLFSAEGADAAMLLAIAAPVVRAPSAAVKSALLARIRSEKLTDSVTVTPRRKTADVLPEGWRFEKLTAADGWVKLPLPGLRMREMAVDAARDTALLFIEMASGAIFPDHDHSATERGLVLTGDLRMGERLLGAGDFYEAAAGTRHERIASPSGCTGLLWVGAEAWRRWREMAVAR